MHTQRQSPRLIPDKKVVGCMKLPPANTFGVKSCSERTGGGGGGGGGGGWGGGNGSSIT